MNIPARAGACYVIEIVVEFEPIRLRVSERRTNRCKDGLVVFGNKSSRRRERRLRIPCAVLTAGVRIMILYPFMRLRQLILRKPLTAKGHMRLTKVDRRIPNSNSSIKDTSRFKTRSEE